MADTRQVAEEVAAALQLSVTEVARVLRAEHSVVQRRVAAGERVVLTGFLATEPTSTGGVRFTAGTRFRRVLQGAAEPPTIAPATARASSAKPAAKKATAKTAPKKAAVKKATTKPAAKKTTAKKATAKTAAKKTTAKKKATAKTTAKRATAKKTTPRKAPAKKTTRNR